MSDDFYGRWLDRPYWTQEEFEYLFFGYDPESPDTEEVFKTEVFYSGDKLESHDYFTKMIIKAIKTGRLNQYINAPFIFFGWAYENPHLRKIIPPKMLEAVEIKIKQEGDKKLSAEPPEPNHQDQTSEIERLRLENEALQLKIDSLEKQIAEHPYITSHRSELLDIVHESIARYWENHDQRKAPKQEFIKPDLLKHYPYLKQPEINAIDSIMRPNRNKRGKEQHIKYNFKS